MDLYYVVIAAASHQNLILLTMDLRTTTPADFHSITNIYKHYVRTSISTLEENEPDAPNMHDELAAILSSGVPFIVAPSDSTDTEVRGYAYAGPFNDRSGYRTTSETSIYIHPDHRGQGLGKELLRELLQRLKATGKTVQVIAKMSILPEQAVEDLPSCRLHQAFGFRTVGRLEKVGRKFGGWIDVVIMQTDLESAVL